MKEIRILLLIIPAILFFSSCYQTIILVDANKIEYLGEDQETDSVILFKSYYSDNAIEYLIFEMDLQNNSEKVIEFSYEDIELIFRSNKNDEVLIINPLSKEELINNLARDHKEAKKRKREGNILGVVFFGVGVFLAGTDIIEADAVSELISDIVYHNDNFKVLIGSIEDRKQYVNDWVIGNEKLNPGEQGSWDILFQRQSKEGDATFIFELEGQKYTQEYRLFFVSRKVPK
ncbi:MAG: hypothetical protein KJO50_07885 [Bacteroidia bacterium]|nr:hypothetical protein [Bacteroidia bacterium]MBT8230166.1 hypothetical protein [Bacteroidia bacterium]NNK90680.1 hypothetical protein [Saprospiraceae bacterium]